MYQPYQPITGLELLKSALERNKNSLVHALSELKQYEDNIETLRYQIVHYQQNTINLKKDIEILEKNV